MTSPRDTHLANLDRFTSAARRCSWQLLSAYSSSFSLASRLFAPETRDHVAAIYALVRVADEIVDGTFAPPAENEREAEELRELLDGYRREVYAALRRGFVTDPIVHAFAATAAQYGIGEELIEPFFRSMDMDITRTEHTAETLAEYIHGSAEVIGEMCMRVFAGGALADDPEAAAAARALGAGFQKANFLRDVREDTAELGRNYFPGRDPHALTEQDVAELCDEIDADFAHARTGIVRIPGRDRAAVLAAHDLFAELARRLREAGPERIAAGRVSVPTRRKAKLVAGALRTSAVMGKG
ncbi:phytoene/squalene synthase family protein [Dietzia sp.]|uniref:phytoene/squalene synthase family protein n=1 Tax=Dietzia sp. TaxID=1871616 RepID=UPI002FDB3D48